MFSDVIKSALEKEVVGQPKAINSVVRGVTRIMSGVTPRERSLATYMFMGPTGTGKTHLVQTLARIVHGDDQHVIVADCTHFMHADPWLAFVSQLMPLFQTAPQEQPANGKVELAQPPPLSIIRIENLQRAPEEVAKALAVALETGRVVLPEGRRGDLRNCLIFLTTGLCAREILDEGPRLGFTATQPAEEATDDQEEDSGPDEPVDVDRLHRICWEQAGEKFGRDLVARLDALIVFHPLQEHDLAKILDRRLQRLNDWLMMRGYRCELQPGARRFLLAQGRRHLRLGARDLVRAHQRFLEFPVADLLLSGRIPPGGMVTVDHQEAEGFLHFTVDQPGASRRFEAAPSAYEIPVQWQEDTATIAR